MLGRVFLGWLRGERGHCSMVAVPSVEEEDAKRPSRERESLVGERTRIINRMKSALVRLGIRGFKPELRRAPQRLESLRSPEDRPIPPNTLDEFRRDLARLALIRNQIETIERDRLERLKQAPKTGGNAMARVLASIIGVGVETADMLVQEILHETCATEGLWHDMPGSPARPTKAVPRGERRDWPNPAMLEFAAA